MANLPEERLGVIMAEVSDLKLAVATLLVKTKHYNILWDYYEGRQPIIYSYDRLREIFVHFNARFTQNWCAVVVDTVIERLTLQRITIADDETRTQALAKLLSASSLLLEADDVHLAALVTGEAYVIVWPDMDTGEPEIYYNDSRNVHIFYEASRPRVKRFAAKWWIGDDDFRYLTLYYPDRLEYYRSTKQVRSSGNSGAGYISEVSSNKSFEPIQEPAVNPYGRIPVFHFRRDRRTISSELVDIIEPQDAVNKLLADMMVAAEFGAFKQRYIISNSDPGKLKNAPNIIWDIPGGDGEGQATSVGEFDATPLENYLVGIDKWTSFIAIRSRVPKHYFYGQGGDPSGEALIALEAPLNHKAEKYINRFMDPWTEVGVFVAELGGLGEVDPDAVIPIFDTPETVQPYTQALIRKENTAAGIPLMWQMKQEGFTEQELDELEEARTEEQEVSTERMTQIMEQRASAFAQNGNNQEELG